MKREKQFTKITPIRWLQKDFERLNEAAYRARRPFSVYVREMVLKRSTD